MRGWVSGAVSLAGAAAVGAAGCGLVIVLSDHLSRRLMIACAAILLLFAAVLLHRQPRHVILFAWVASLTYYRTYLIPGLGDIGARGPYWMRSDLLLAALFAWWVFEAAILKRQPEPHGVHVWPFLTPLVVVCILSVLTAEISGRAMTDLARVVKLALFAWYARYNIRQTELWWCVAGIGVAMTAQSAVGLIQVTTGRLAPGGLDAGGFLRASGTMVHPNVLAPYMLLVTPIFIALAFRASDRRLRRLSSIPAAAGIVAVVCCMSRAPWVLIAAEAVAVLAVMVWLRHLRMQLAAGIMVTAMLVSFAAALPFAEKLETRILGNLNQSLEFRESMNTASWKMFLDHPLLGVGLNHFATALPAYDHSFDDAIDVMDLAIEMNARPMVAVHNYYLLILAETGILGLASMLLFLAWASWVGLRAIRRTSGDLQAVSIGILIGIAGLLVEELADFSLWMDPALFTFVLLASLLNVVPSMECKPGDPVASTSTLLPEGVLA